MTNWCTSYVTTDQKNEGYERAIIAVTKIYLPIINKLENIQAKITAATDKEISYYEKEVVILKLECYVAEVLTDNLKNKIKSQSARKAEKVDIFFNNVNSYGMFSGKIKGAFGSGNNVLSDLCELINFFENKMDKKREKYFKIAFELYSLEWQKIIKRRCAEIVNSIKNLKSLKISNSESLEYLSGIVDEALEEYCETLAKYNALKEMED